jgi:hypothetical protein
VIISTGGRNDGYAVAGGGYDISDVYGRDSHVPLKAAEHAERASETEECIRNFITTEIFGVRFLTLVLGDVP